jgi:hypothetical protein
VALRQVSQGRPCAEVATDHLVCVACCVLRVACCVLRVACVSCRLLTLLETHAGTSRPPFPRGRSSACWATTALARPPRSR